MGEPTVTTVIPAFGAESYLAGTIDSILAQTLVPDEVVVVDDGSADGTARVAASYPAPVRVIRHESNRGPAAARNTGVRHASGDLVALLDSGDIWYPTKLERQIEALHESTAEAGVVFCLTRIVRLDGLAFIDCGHVPSPQADPTGFRRALLLQNAVSGSGCSPLIRRDLLLSVGGWDESLRTCEDWDLWLRLAHRTAFHRVDEVLCEAPVRAAGLSLKLDRLRADARTVLRRHLPDLVDSPERADQIERSALRLIDGCFDWLGGHRPTA